MICVVHTAKLSDPGQMSREKSDFGQLGLLCKCYLTSNKTVTDYDCKNLKMPPKIFEVAHPPGNFIYSTILTHWHFKMLCKKPPQNIMMQNCSDKNNCRKNSKKKKIGRECEPNCQMLSSHCHLRRVALATGACGSKPIGGIT